jgi:hypothetical protein
MLVWKEDIYCCRFFFPIHVLENVQKILYYNRSVGKCATDSNSKTCKDVQFIKCLKTLLLLLSILGEYCLVFRHL